MIRLSIIAFIALCWIPSLHAQELKADREVPSVLNNNEVSFSLTNSRREIVFFLNESPGSSIFKLTGSLGINAPVLTREKNRFVINIDSSLYLIDFQIGRMYTLTGVLMSFALNDRKDTICVFSSSGPVSLRRANLDIYDLEKMKNIFEYKDFTYNGTPWVRYNGIGGDFRPHFDTAKAKFVFESLDSLNHIEYRYIDIENQQLILEKVSKDRAAFR